MRGEGWGRGKCGEMRVREVGDVVSGELMVSVEER